MIKWNLNAAGPKAKVIDEIKAATITASEYESMSKEMIKRLTPEDHEEFERVKAFVLAEIEHCTAPNIGVTCRQVMNPLEAGPGDTLQLSIAEYA